MNSYCRICEAEPFDADWEFLCPEHQPLNDDGTINTETLRAIEHILSEAHLDPHAIALGEYIETIEQRQETLKRQYELWKVPDVDAPFETSFELIGIYPTGELMGCYTTERSVVHAKALAEKRSPSSRFGETMDDAPYQFIINSRIIPSE